MMAASFIYLLMIVSIVGIITNPSSRFASGSSHLPDFSIIHDDGAAFSDSLHRDYSPQAPPPPSPPPYPPPLSCEDLKGVGSINTTCQLNYNLNFTEDVYVKGEGNLFVLQGVILDCPHAGCSITINITGDFKLSSGAQITAGSVYIEAGNVTLCSGSLINSTALGGEPPVSYGTPEDYQGGGGGFGGRGASCVMDNQKHPEDVWGGDAYGWEWMAEPWMFGSKGGTTNKEDDFGGRGGGRIRFSVLDTLEASGGLLADGGDGGIKGGGGSGGSIFIKTLKM